jgi:hypothetical protein
LSSCSHNMRMENTTVVPQPPPSGTAARMSYGGIVSCYLKHHDEDAHFRHNETSVVDMADGVGCYRLPRPGRGCLGVRARAHAQRP